MILMIVAVKILVASRRLSCHLVRLFKKWFIPNLLQHLLYRLLEHGINRLGIGRTRLPHIVFLRPVIVVPVRPEIPPLLRDYLSLSFSLQLVFFYSSLFINPIHQLLYTSDRFTS